MALAISTVQSSGTHDLPTTVADLHDDTEQSTDTISTYLYKRSRTVVRRDARSIDRLTTIGKAVSHPSTRITSHRDGRQTAVGR